MSAPYRQVLDILDSHGIDIDSYSPLEQGALIYDITQTLGIQVPQFKDNRNSVYRLRGFKVTQAIERYTAENRCEVYCTYINMGEMPLRDAETVNLARQLTGKAVPDDVPQRHKVEKGLTRNSLVHVHSIFPSKKKPPKQIRHNGKVYKVNAVILGTDPKYKGTLREQLVKMVKYLFKPSNFAATEYHKKVDLKHLAYYEWFAEQRNADKPKGVRLSWNRNIK